MYKGLIALALSLTAATAAQAGPLDWLFPFKPKPPTTVKAPEIDPGTALSGLTLLAGGLAVIRGRRGKQ